MVTEHLTSSIILNRDQKITIQYYPTWACDYIKTETVTAQRFSQLMNQSQNSGFYLVIDDKYISDFTIDFSGTGRNTKAVITI